MLKSSKIYVVVVKCERTLIYGKFDRLPLICPYCTVPTRNYLHNLASANSQSELTWMMVITLRSEDERARNSEETSEKNAFTCQLCIVPIKEKQHEDEINKIQDSDITRYFCFYYVTNVMRFSFPLAVDITLRLHWKLQDKITSSV